MKEKLNEYLLDAQDAEKSNATVEKYKRVVNQMIEHIDHEGEVKKSDIIAWKKSLTDEYSIATQHQYIILINKFLEYCETGDIDSKSKTSKLRVKNVRSQENYTINNVLTDQEYLRMEKYARKLGMYETMLTMEVLAHTGIRFSELKFITVENVKNHNQFIVTNKGKTRQVTIPDATKRKLNRYIKEAGIESGYIFPSARDKDKPLPKSTFWDRLQKIAGKAKIGLDKAHAHSFRHLFAKMLLATGEDTAKIADILGHSSIDTTRKYLRSSDKEMRETMNKVKYRKKRKEKEEE